MNAFFTEIALAAAEQLTSHENTYAGQPGVSLAQHIRLKRKELAASAKGYRLIYLDTNAWKCVADFQSGKPTLKPEMQYFAAMVERASNSDVFAFPIGAPTLFELDAMKSDQTRDSINPLVNRLSRGLCFQPHTERLDTELGHLRSGQFPEREGLDSFLCSPVELLGIPQIEPTSTWPRNVDALAFNKAIFDVMAGMPISVLLELGRHLDEARWDNSLGIDELNASKAANKNVVINLNTGIAIELSRIIQSWHQAVNAPITADEVTVQAVCAMGHWHENPETKALPTLRTLASTHGLMRHDRQRTYHKGDPNDFMVAATALPVCSALFTDRALANLLADKRISTKRYSNCEVVSGYQAMARYLEQYL